MKKITLTFCMLLTVLFAFSQGKTADGDIAKKMKIQTEQSSFKGAPGDTLIWEDFQDEAIEASWFNISLDGHADANGRPDEWYVSVYRPQVDPDAACVVAPTDTNIVAASSSWFTGYPCCADNWLMTEPFTGDASTILRWASAPSQGPTYVDGYEVLISTGPDFTDESTYTTVLASFDETDGAGAYQGVGATEHPYLIAAGSAALATSQVDLSAYDGQEVAIAFHHNSNDDNFIQIDDIFVGKDPSTGTARLQVIHNSGDIAASTVDIWSGEEPILNEFAFRTATAFMDVPAGVDMRVRVSGGSADCVDNSVAEATVNLIAGRSYIAFANGVIDPSMYAANPDGASTMLSVMAMAGEESATGTNFNLGAIHGATDAPTIDGSAAGFTIVDDLSYNQTFAHTAVPAFDVVLDITDASGANNIASYDLVLSDKVGGAGVLFASGFVDPSMNQSGEAFHMWMALADGTTYPLPLNATGLNNAVEIQGVNLFPNPTNNSLNVQYNVVESSNVSISVLNSVGQNVMNVTASNALGNQTENVDVSTLANGVYMLQINTNSGTVTKKFTVLK